jgi:hypothetical protein
LSLKWCFLMNSLTCWKPPAPDSLATENVKFGRLNEF